MILCHRNFHNRATITGGFFSLYLGSHPRKAKKENYMTQLHMKATQWSGPSCLRSLIAHTYVDMKVSCNSGSLKSPLRLIFSAAKYINYKICHAKFGVAPIPTVFFANPIFPYCYLTTFQLSLKKGFPFVICPALEWQPVSYLLPVLTF